jgi:hypothetical protein
LLHHCEVTCLLEIHLIEIAKKAESLFYLIRSGTRASDDALRAAGTHFNTGTSSDRSTHPLLWQPYSLISVFCQDNRAIWLSVDTSETLPNVTCLPWLCSIAYFDRLSFPGTLVTPYAYSHFFKISNWRWCGNSSLTTFPRPIAEQVGCSQMMRSLRERTSQLRLQQEGPNWYDRREDKCYNPRKTAGDESRIVSQHNIESYHEYIWERYFSEWPPTWLCRSPVSAARWGTEADDNGWRKVDPAASHRGWYQDLQRAKSLIHFQSFTWFNFMNCQLSHLDMRLIRCSMHLNSHGMVSEVFVIDWFSIHIDPTTRPWNVTFRRYHDSSRLNQRRSTAPISVAKDSKKPDCLSHKNNGLFLDSHRQALQPRRGIRWESIAFGTWLEDQYCILFSKKYH